VGILDHFSGERRQEMRISYMPPVVAGIRCICIISQRLNKVRVV